MPASVQSAARVAKLAAGSAVKVSRVFVDRAFGSADALAATLTDELAVGATTDMLVAVAGPEAAASVAMVAQRAGQAAAGIVQELTLATAELVREFESSSVDVVRHAYGEEASELASAGLSAAVDASAAGPSVCG